MMDSGDLWGQNPTLSEEQRRAVEASAWRTIFRARRRAALGIWSIVAFMIPFGALPRQSALRKPVAFLSMAAIATVVGLLLRVRCPHCGGRFFMRGRRPRRGSCGQCGAGPGTPNPPSGADLIANRADR